jgi:Flp pilus assembly CpaF family ATPase
MRRLQAAVLRQGVATRANILVAAGTSTGKTTLTKPSVGFARAQWQITAPADVHINDAECLELVDSSRK